MSEGKSCDGTHSMQRHVSNFHKAQGPNVMNDFFMIFARLELLKQGILINICYSNEGVIISNRNVQK